MTRRRLARFFLWALLALLGACAATTPPAPDADARLRRLMDDSDEALLDRNPLWALYRGDTRRADRFGDYLSPGYIDAERRAAEGELAALAQIPRDRLSGTDQIAYDTFRWAVTDRRERMSPPAATVWPMLALNPMTGWQMDFATLSSGSGVAPYRRGADYDAGLTRIDGFIAWLARAQQRMREGLGSGVVLPRVAVQRLIEQFDRFAAQGMADSPYLGPIRAFPDAVPVAERERLTRAYTDALQHRLQPAFVRVRAFLADEVLPRAPAAVGLSAVPGGAAYYDVLVRSNTTTTLTTAEIHRLGLAEVERITAAMAQVQQQVGFAGTPAEFLVMLRTNPRFSPASAQAMADGYADIGQRVDRALPRLFDTPPKTPLAIRPTPDYQAPTDAAARYSSGSLDTGQPGVFYFNTFDLPSRCTWAMETLYLHEAVPGHHLQASLATENTALPTLLRFDGNTAYIEGWALYAESLGSELGLFTDPYQRFGHLNDEMLRAMRLVVDTGLHANGWTREQAIDYLLAHSAMGRTDAVAEVERYIADPGQALAYKVGALTIQRLRRRAEQALGPRFDVRAFHQQVLGTGSVPMGVLEKKIDAWIAATTAASP